MNRGKLQITLPEDLKDLVQTESKKNFMSVSLWIERAVIKYLENENSKNKKNEKKIDLGI